MNQPVLKLIAGLLLVLLQMLEIAPAQARLTDELTDDQLAWHWDAVTRDRARQATLALAIWLESDPRSTEQWQDRVEANRLAVLAAAQRVPPEQSALADGLFAWFIQSRDLNLSLEQVSVALPWDDDVVSLLRPDPQAGRLARMQELMAFWAPDVWAELRRRLNVIDDLPDEPESAERNATDSDVDSQDPDQPEVSGDVVNSITAEEQINGYWQALMLPQQQQPELAPESETETETETLSSAEQPGQAELPEPSIHAQAQAARVEQWRQGDEIDQRRQVLIQIITAELEMKWAANRRLSAVWDLIYALAEAAALDQPQSVATELRLLIGTLISDSGRDLRLIDTDLPVILALLEDSALQLEAESANPSSALGLLGDAYARLGLFAVDAEFYLDQPVRDGVSSALGACAVDPTVMGPLPRSVFEDCLELLVGQMDDSLGRVELVGDRDGPFSSIFLRREMGLVSWQRVAYLDGHLNWLLGASCSPPIWQNPLEWSLLAHYLSRWVAQRPVFFDSPRWRDAVDAFERQATTQREASILFIDCLSGMGRQRQDPILRLINQHQEALSALEDAVTAAENEFFAEVTRAQADIDLDSDAEQLTSYRPEDLTIGPCPDAAVCGVQIELPVSRALLGEFPNAFLLADQLKIGQLDLCYSDVRWGDREARPARNNDPRVADYFGSLSFDLIGTFERAGRTEQVFRQRLRSTEPRHYLFASSEPEVLTMDCPDTLADQPIASRLADDHLGLVPDRLTYFVSQPTTAEAELLANWDQGAEWRDWFVTGDRVDTVEMRDGSTLAVEVEAQMKRLTAQRERALSTRMLSRLSPAQVDPDALTSAMSAVAENSAMLRRVLEIHYPRIIRQDESIRAYVTGEEALLNQDRVRQLADSDIVLRQAAGIGQARLDRLRERWLDFPVELRESGQVSPELDFAAERLANLRRLSRNWQEPDESLPAQ